MTGFSLFGRGVRGLQRLITDGAAGGLTPAPGADWLLVLGSGWPPPEPDWTTAGRLCTGGEDDARLGQSGPGRARVPDSADIMTHL